MIENRSNAKQSKVRAAVEPVFARQKHRMGLLRTIGIAHAEIEIGMANLVYHLQRLPWLEGRLRLHDMESATRTRPT